MKHVILTYFLTFSLQVFIGTACIAQPRIEDPALLLMVLDHRLQEQEKDCLFVGYNRNLGNSGILGCFKYRGVDCQEALQFQDENSRRDFVSELNQAGLSSSQCLIPSSKALSEINGLTLPAHLYMTLMGGDNGAHTKYSFLMVRVDSCESLGLASATFLGGASRLASQVEMDFLSTSRGLIALKDDTGECAVGLGLSVEQQSTAAAVETGILARFGVCDFGADDPALTDCPAHLQNSDYFLPGISEW